MEKTAVIYFEGNDSKVTLFSKDKDKNLHLIKAESISASMAFSEKQQPATAYVDENSQIEMLNFETVSDSSAFNNSYIQSLNKFFDGEELKKIKFIPVLAEPAVHFQKVDDEKDLSNYNIGSNGKGKKDNFGIVDIVGKSKLLIYPSGKSNYLQALDSLAKLNQERFIKIDSVKNAEILLVNFVTKKEKLLANENSLILYIGKDYSKIIFLKGEKILHIGSTVNAGKNSSNPYYVIMSKILLEMENASIANINKVFIFGEDKSDALQSALKHSYPEAEIKNISFDNFKIPGKNPFNYDISAYSVNIAAIEEHYNQPKERSINLLPKYIVEEQKPFGWESYVLLIILFASVFGMTYLILNRNANIKKMDSRINELLQVEAENKEISAQIQNYQNKINNFEQSSRIIQTYSQNTGMLSSALKKIAVYADQRRNIWFTGLTTDASLKLNLTGYAMGRDVLTKLSYSYNDALLSGIIFEPLRDYKAYKFNIVTTLNDSKGEMK